jgi:hypothetical protein
VTIGVIAALVLLTAIDGILVRRFRDRRNPDDVRFYNEERTWVDGGNYPVALQRVYPDEPLAVSDRRRMTGLGYTATQTRRLDTGVITEWQRTERIDTVVAAQLFTYREWTLRLWAGPPVSLLLGIAIAVGFWLRDSPLSTFELITAIAVTAAVVFLPIAYAVAWKRPAGTRLVLVAQLLIAAAVVAGLDEERSAGTLRWAFLVAVFALLPLLVSTGELLVRRRPEV